MTMELRQRFEAEAAPLLTLFTAVLLLDQDLRVRYASDTLAGYMPELVTGPRLDEAFKLLRPRVMPSYEEALQQDPTLYLLTAASGAFAVRGQLIPGRFGDEDCLVFCGAPWLSWMVTNRPEIKLQLQDFSPQDVQLDQLFYMSTEARMVEDLEELNGKLKQAKEETEAAQASKDELFARMSHEMRTPLNGVVSALTLLRDEPIEGKPRELLELASKSSSNLMQVINYVLDVSKIESGDSPVEESDFELRELVSSVNDVVRARALEKGLALSNHCAATLPSRYSGDAGRLRQALLNLVINAIKFTESGGVTIDVLPVNAESDLVRFEVQDTGMGIPRHEQASIFEPFTRLSGAAEAGTGLGLDIARRNVEAMGGKIGVSSAPGVGSTFWIELPLRVVAGAEPESSEPPAGEPAAEGATPAFQGNVLLVDDNETNLMLGTMILERLGVAVTRASSGQAAVAAALSGEHDLVLMDISMPDIDGYEATRRIREHLDAQALPVVALTAYASSVEQEQSAASGMNGYLTKPIDRERLVEALQAWLAVRDAGSAVEEGVAAEGEPSALVDLAVLQELLRQIGFDNLATVIGKFTEEASRRWQALAAASDGTVRAREAHTLASTCGSFGLPTVADRFRTIEKLAGAGADTAALGLAETGSDLTRGLEELKTAVAGLAPES